MAPGRVAARDMTAPARQVCDRSLRGKWSRLQAESEQGLYPESSPFPTEAQLDLLKAALLPAEHAAPAWRRWKGRGQPLQSVYGVSTRLFPQLWDNRAAARIDAEDIPLLKGAYRHTLTVNAVKIRDALIATDRLAEAGIPVLFCKGAAMIAMAGDRLGLRPFADVDILVPEPDAARAVALLLDSGHESRLHPAIVGLLHSWACGKPNGAELDVHWWVFKTAGDDSEIFDTAREATLLGRTVRVPSATDCLVIAIANAFFPDQGSPLRWITDTLLLFEVAGDQIDWELVLRRARRPGLALGLAAGLDYLAREFNAPVPDDVIEELRRRPVTRLERAAHWTAVNRPPVGVDYISHVLRYRSRRRYHAAGTSGLPRDLLSHIAQWTDGPGARRRDLLKRAPRRAVRGAALLAVRYGPSTNRSNSEPTDVH